MNNDANKQKIEKFSDNFRFKGHWHVTKGDSDFDIRGNKDFRYGQNDLPMERLFGPC